MVSEILNWGSNMNNTIRNNHQGGQNCGYKTRALPNNE